MPAEVKSSVTNDRRLGGRRAFRSTMVPAWQMALPTTADPSRGSSNLAFVPRAGNISSDTRAGTAA
jgi:hypothetical protein